MAEKTPVKKAVKKPKTPAAHPKYSDMVATAVGSLKERGGSSRQAILKYIMANFKVGSDAKAINAHLKIALRNGVKKGALKQSKGTGAAGSFKLGEKPKPAKKPAAKKVVKPKAAKPKKPAAKKATTSATAKKPKAKTPKKAATKKTTEKKPSKKTTKPKTPKKKAIKSPKKAKTDKPKKAKAAKKNKMYILHRPNDT
ncbi:histone H1-delta-like [Ylistrum balloti]|uniref:histone H1-delta-like n=3 Tax=Ylistrum balloti TaxID=509963 RepID=UPI002905BC8D|nr:histone H1-delta-like [Ylistrum balloti]